MSVPQPLRNETKLKLLDQVMKLTAYTLNIVNNEKRFPKRYRWCCTSKIVDSTYAILNYVNKANDIFVKTIEDYKLRRNYQQIAYSECRALLGMVDIATTSFNLTPSESWVVMIAEIKSAIKQWLDNDFKRYGTI